MSTRRLSTSSSLLMVAAPVMSKINKGPWQLVLGSIPDAPSSGPETASEAMVKVGDIPDASSGDSESPSAMPDVEGAAEVSYYRDLQLMPISLAKI